MRSTRMQSLFWIFLEAVCCAPLSPKNVQAAPTRVAVELVLAIDCSASVDRQEFRAQLEGLSLAFRDPEVLDAIEDLKPLGAAVAVLEWAGRGEASVVVPFTRIHSVAEAEALSTRIKELPRDLLSGFTSIASAIEVSLLLIRNNEFDGQRLVIDVSGDGTDNDGGDLAAERTRALSAGVTINGLPIKSEIPDLDEYYRLNVITGAGSFVLPASDYEDYRRAIREKLLAELKRLAS